MSGRGQPFLGRHVLGRHELYRAGHAPLHALRVPTAEVTFDCLSVEQFDRAERACLNAGAAANATCCDHLDQPALEFMNRTSRAGVHARSVSALAASYGDVKSGF